MLARSEFQFQYGAIEGSNNNWRSVDIRSVFQFQYGAIEGFHVYSIPTPCFISIPVWCDWRYNCPPDRWILLSNFNSSMVRLKAVEGWLQHRHGQISIPVWCDWRAVTRCVEHHQFLFQFQYGAIEGTEVAQMAVESQISIPVWCDWRWTTPSSPATSALFQFQYGAIEGLLLIPRSRCLLVFNSSMVRLKAVQAPKKNVS